MKVGRTGMVFTGLQAFFQGEGFGTGRQKYTWPCVDRAQMGGAGQTARDHA